MVNNKINSHNNAYANTWVLHGVCVALLYNDFIVNIYIQLDWEQLSFYNLLVPLHTNTLRA